MAQGYEQQSLIITTNLEFSQWSQVFGSEQLTGALLDQLTHHAHILAMNGKLPVLGELEIREVRVKLVVSGEFLVLGFWHKKAVTARGKEWL